MRSLGHRSCRILRRQPKASSKFARELAGVARPHGSPHDAIATFFGFSNSRQ